MHYTVRLSVHRSRSGKGVLEPKKGATQDFRALSLTLKTFRVLGLLESKEWKHPLRLECYFQNLLCVGA